MPRVDSLRVRRNIDDIFRSRGQSRTNGPFADVLALVRGRRRDGSRLQDEDQLYNGVEGVLSFRFDVIMTKFKVNFHQVNAPVMVSSTRRRPQVRQTCL